MLRKLIIVLTLITLAAIVGCSKDCPNCPKEPTVFYVNKHKIDFGATQTNATFAISNKGKGTLGWTISISPSSAAAKVDAATQGGWLSVSPLNGSGDATISCSADRSKLDKLGISRATLIVDTPNSTNTTRDSIEVYILNAGTWLMTDDGTFERCWEVDSLDYYWVKEFKMPQGQDRIFVDSLKMNFCQGDTIIQLLAYQRYDTTGVAYNWPAPQPFYASEFVYEVANGWNTFPLDLYLADSVFFLGYFQPGATRPDLNIDTDSTSDFGIHCWRARDISTEPGSVDLRWEWQKAFETFAFRAFVTPVLQYNPKMAALAKGQGAEVGLRTGYAHKGLYPVSIRPKMVQ